MAESKLTPKSTRVKNIAGQRFGKLTALSYAGLDNGFEAMWLCLCDCGNQHTARSSAMRSGHIHSCGCQTSRTHGKTTSRAYRSWSMAKARCSPTSDKRRYYSDRGITMCEQWRDSFEQFYADMGDRPQGYTLERINNDGNYEPGNCKWAPVIEQANNKTINVKLTFNGETLSASQWARRTGISSDIIRWRLREGWPINEILDNTLRGWDLRKKRKADHT